MSTGLRDRRLGRQVRGEAARACLAGTRLDAEPRRLAGVGARDPRAAGVGDDADAVAAGQRLAGQQRGDVEQLADRAGADHAGVAEQRVDGGVGRGEQRAGVRGRRPWRRPPSARS